MVQLRLPVVCASKQGCALAVGWEFEKYCQPSSTAEDTLFRLAPGYAGVAHVTSVTWTALLDTILEGDIPPSVDWPHPLRIGMMDHAELRETATALVVESLAASLRNNQVV